MEEIKITDGSGDKKYFTIIPNYILNHSTLWDREVYIQMKRITGENGTCWTSQKTLSKQCGISVNRLKKSLKYLTDHNWIKLIGIKRIKTKGGVQEVNEYKVADLWKLNVDYYESKRVSPNDTPYDKGVSPEKVKGYHENGKGVSSEDYKEEPSNNIIIKNNPITTHSVEDNKEISYLIDLFNIVNPSYKQLFMRKPQREAISRLTKSMGREKLEQAIKLLPEIRNYKFAPVITTPIQLEEKMGALISFLQRNSQSKMIKL